MSTLGKTLTNPIVLGGGALVGLFLLVNRSPANVASGVNPVLIGATTQMNTAALGAQVEQSEIQADLARAGMSYDLARQGQVMSYLTNQSNNMRQLAMQRVVSETDISKTLIASNTAITVDRNQNMTRLGLAQYEVMRERIRTDGQVQVARYQYKGTKVSAIANTIGTIAGSAANVVKLFA